MTYHPGQREAVARKGLPVIVAVVPVGIGDDRFPAYFVERDLLGCRVAGCCNHNGFFQMIRVGDRPVQDLHTAHGTTHDRVELADFKVIDKEFLGVHHVPDRDDRELRPPGFPGSRVGGCRAGRTLASADDIRADHKVPVGIQRLAGTDDGIPPAGLIITIMEPGNMGITGEGVADKNGIALLAVEFSVCFKRKGKRRKSLPALQGEGGGMLICLGFYNSHGSFDHRQAPFRIASSSAMQSRMSLNAAAIPGCTGIIFLSFGIILRPAPVSDPQ